MIESAEVTALHAELAQAQLELEEAAKILQGSGYPGVGSLLLIAVARIEATLRSHWCEICGERIGATEAFVGTGTGTTHSDCYRNSQ